MKLDRKNAELEDSVFNGSKPRDLSLFSKSLMGLSRALMNTASSLSTLGTCDMMASCSETWTEVVDEYTDRRMTSTTSSSAEHTSVHRNDERCPVNSSNCGIGSLQVPGRSIEVILLIIVARQEQQKHHRRIEKVHEP
jgi:hypothetical protein